MKVAARNIIYCSLLALGSQPFSHAAGPMRKQIINATRTEVTVAFLEQNGHKVTAVVGPYESIDLDHDHPLKEIDLTIDKQVFKYFENDGINKNKILNITFSVLFTNA
jgi:hypothetical protein